MTGFSSSLSMGMAVLWTQVLVQRWCSRTYDDWGTKESPRVRVVGSSSNSEEISLECGTDTRWYTGPPCISDTKYKHHVSDQKLFLLVKTYQNSSFIPLVAFAGSETQYFIYFFLEPVPLFDPNLPVTSIYSTETLILTIFSITISISKSLQSFCWHNRNSVTMNIVYLI